MTVSLVAPAQLDIKQVLNKFNEKKGLNYFEQHALFHLSHYVPQFSELCLKYPKNEPYLRSESLKAMKKWTYYTKLCHSINNSLFNTLSHTAINSIILGDGLCAAITLQYLTHFINTNSPLTFSSLPFKSEPISLSGVNFYPLETLAEEELEKKTRELRFLQATYKMSSIYKEKDSLEYIPKSVLQNKELVITKRLPDLKNSPQAFSINDLILKLDPLNEQDKEYIMGISSENNSHAIFLHLQSPFHFFDPAFGLTKAEQKKDFFLFLANYLTEKYPDYSSFALLEFSKKPAPVK